MEYVSLIFSVLFFLGALTSISWGIDIIRINPKSDVNRAFLFLCIALSIWSFGFAMANITNSLITALFWRRFSSVGMISLFSIILHFLLLVTKTKEELKINKKRYLLYVPMFVFIYVFTFSSNLSNLQYDLMKTNLGLANVASNTIWNYLYYTYYSIYLMLSLKIVWTWKKRLKEEIQIRQAGIIFVTIIFATILGSLTDIISASFMLNPLPQMAPLFILIPVWAMYYSAKNYGLIDQRKVTKVELIITEKEKERIFYSIAFAFCVGGILSFGFEYSLVIRNVENSINLGILKSIMYFVTGILIYIIQGIKKETVKDALTIIILVVNIPIITLYFIEYSSITVWAFPLIVIITSLVFIKKTLLISTAVVSIATQRLIWLLEPEKIVIVDKYDYILRMLLILAALIIGYYVNKVYVARIVENNFQIRFQKLNAKISSEFIGISSANKDDKINMLLSEIGLFFEVDRTYLFLIDHADNTMTNSHEWRNEVIEAEVQTIESIPLTIFPWWIDQLQQKKLVLIDDINTMPKDAFNEKEQLLRQKVKSLVSVPVEGEEGLKGFIGIDSVKTYRKWTDQDIKLFTILSNILSEGLTKIKTEKELEQMAYYDILTKLPNRFLFKKEVQKAIRKAQDTGYLFNIIFIDLDNFKSINDTMGHDGGDYLLKEVSRKLKSRVRETDIVARFGGDEFMILLKDIKEQKDVEIIANNIMNMFSKPFTIADKEFSVTGSAGISTYSIDGIDPETLIKNADIAMYEAKAQGKNRYSFCTTNMKDEVQKNLTISNDLYFALEKDQLSVYYQPQMDLSNTKIVGLEALLRWKHPKLGMIPPNVFIPIAEKNGLINSIGEWILTTSCAQNKKWQDMGLDKLIMAVNLSGIQFINVNIAEDISRILHETGLDPKHLELEITESIAIKETDFVVEVLHKLKKIGVSIAIDDFGTQYSSLSRLKLLPIDRLKIDIEFIKGIENSDKDKAIAATVINLAKSLGLNVLAEGVETAPQLEFLNQKMCDYVQGYYYYKPMPANEIEKILQDLNAPSLDN